MLTAEISTFESRGRCKTSSNIHIIHNGKVVASCIKGGVWNVFHALRELIRHPKVFKKFPGFEEAHGTLLAD